MIDNQPHPALIQWEAKVGIYENENLRMEIQSLGWNRGLEIRWRWARGANDLALMGVLDSSKLGLAVLTSMTPWWGTGALRQFAQVELDAGAPPGSWAFRWAMDDTQTTWEWLCFDFTSDRALTFRVEMKGPAGSDFDPQFRKSWQLHLQGDGAAVAPIVPAALTSASEP